MGLSAIASSEELPPLKCAQNYDSVVKHNKNVYYNCELYLYRCMHILLFNTITMPK